jgi:AraC family transcriptional regulator, activator of mtrCDE
MDALSRLVATLDPRGRMDLRCLFGRGFAAPHDAVGPWRAPFHIVLRGECELWLPRSDERVRLQQGSLAILPRGAEHVLRTEAPQRRIRTVRTVPGELVDLKTNLVQTSKAEVEVLCGEFEFAGRRRSALLEALPEHIVVQFGQRPEYAWLEGLIRMMAREIEAQSAGSAVIVAQLSGALFTLAVRAHLEAHPSHAGVLGLMRSTRLAPALQAMLDRPEVAWTVESMADLCHLSRATFAREFDRCAGQAPLAVLTSLRMEKASQLLLDDVQDTASVGEAVGYQSEAAFNRAFARHAGMTPGRFRRAGAEPGAEARRTAA